MKPAVRHVAGPDLTTLRRPLAGPGEGVARSAGAERLVLLLLLALLAVVVAAPAAAQQSGVDREIAESRRRLEQIRKERVQLGEEMKRIRARVHGLSGELGNLQRQMGASSSLLEELDLQLTQHEDQIDENTRDLQATQELLARRKLQLDDRLRDIYKRGPLHTTEVLLTARSFSELINRYKYLLMLARRDRALVREVANLEVQLVSRERTLRRSLNELERVLQEKALEHERLQGLEEDQKRALATTRARERATSQRIEQLARDERELNGLMSRLETKRKEEIRLAEERARRSPGGAGAAAAAPTSTITTADLGNLAWPAQGRVLYRFGRTTQPNGTVLRRNGVGIGAAAGTPVRAVEDGTVVMAGPFEGYGPTVVVSHGGGYYSLYLYLREISVREGEKITRSKVVGTVGGERTPEGPHLEFQVRAPGGQAVDPLSWLRKGPT